jgi:hypothetical protein
MTFSECLVSGVFGIIKPAEVALLERSVAWI